MDFRVMAVARRTLISIEYIWYTLKAIKSWVPTMLPSGVSVGSIMMYSLLFLCQILYRSDFLSGVMSPDSLAVSCKKSLNSATAGGS